MCSGLHQQPGDRIVEIASVDIMRGVRLAALKGLVAGQLMVVGGVA